MGSGSATRLYLIENMEGKAGWQLFQKDNRIYCRQECFIVLFPKYLKTKLERNACNVSLPKLFKNFRKKSISAKLISKKIYLWLSESNTFFRISDLFDNRISGFHIRYSADIKRLSIQPIFGQRDTSNHSRNFFFTVYCTGMFICRGSMRRK